MVERAWPRKKPSGYIDLHPRGYVTILLANHAVFNILFLPVVQYYSSIPGILLVFPAPPELLIYYQYGGIDLHPRGYVTILLANHAVFNILFLPVVQYYSSIPGILLVFPAPPELLIYYQYGGIDGHLRGHVTTL